MIVKVVVRNLVQNQLNVIIAAVMVKSDLAKVSLQSNKHALSVVAMEKRLVKHVRNVRVMEKLKAMKAFQSRSRKVSMMEIV